MVCPNGLCTLEKSIEWYSRIGSSRSSGEIVNPCCSALHGGGLVNSMLPTIVVQKVLTNCSTVFTAVLCSVF